MHRRKSGFTIVEIAVVVAAISLLLAIVLIAFNGTQIRARDQKRAADILTFSAAVDDYYQKNGEYPPYLTDPSGLLSNLYNVKQVKDPLDNSSTALYRTISGSNYCGLSSQAFWLADFCTNYIYFSYNGISGTSGFSDAQMGCTVTLKTWEPGYVIVWRSETRKSIMFSGKNVTVTYLSTPDSHLSGQQCVVTEAGSI